MQERVLDVGKVRDVCAAFGLDRDAWTKLAAGSMRAEDGDTESRH